MDSVQELMTLLDRCQSVRVTSGMSGADVYFLPELSAYLKIAPHNSFSDLRNEKNVLEWLRGRSTVPSVLAYEENADSDILLTSAVEGTVLSDQLASNVSTVDSQLALAAEAARHLRRLHDIPVDDCALDQRLDVKFARAQKNIEYKLLSDTDEGFAAEHDGRMPIDVYRALLASQPQDPDLVFTHGDACMPNMIIDGGSFAGFIDLDGAGVADRYTDIAVFFRSFAYNCRTPVDLSETFCTAYGIDRLDSDKIRFYALLDDLF